VRRARGAARRGNPDGDPDSSPAHHRQRCLRHVGVRRGVRPAFAAGGGAERGTPAPPGVGAGGVADAVPLDVQAWISFIGSRSARWPEARCRTSWRRPWRAPRSWSRTAGRWRWRLVVLADHVRVACWRELVPKAIGMSSRSGSRTSCPAGCGCCRGSRRRCVVPVGLDRLIVRVMGCTGRRPRVTHRGHQGDDGEGAETGWCTRREEMVDGGLRAGERKVKA